MVHQLFDLNCTPPDKQEDDRNQNEREMEDQGQEMKDNNDQGMEDNNDQEMEDNNDQEMEGKFLLNLPLFLSIYLKPCTKTSLAQ